MSKQQGGTVKCEYCGKSVFFAEEQRCDNKVYHIQCFGKYKKDEIQDNLRGRNVMYEKPADVQPAYYRTADGSGLSRMESGSEYKTGSDSPSTTPARNQSSGGGGGGGSRGGTPARNAPASSPQHQQQKPVAQTPPAKAASIKAPPQAKETKLDFGLSKFYLPAVDTEKEMKAAAAQGEPAWQNAGKQAGIQIWRVEKFKIKAWPEDQYGYFFDGDSYIVLNSYGHPQSLRYNVHFWLGQYTTQDEAGTAAYKTVELDDYLGGLPVQYREVQGFESESFLNLFDQVIIQHGGIESGFRHVEPEKYRHRLLHVKGTMKNLVVREVPLSSKSLNSGDVFILDEGTEIYQFIGKHASNAEKQKAVKIIQSLDHERKAQIKGVVLEEANEGQNKAGWDHFWKALGGKTAIADHDASSDAQVLNLREMFKVSDESGKLQFTPVNFARSSLEEDDAFVVSTGPIVFVWIGKRANANEKKSAFYFAQEYLNENPKLVKTTPIVRLLSGSENEEFNSYFS
jgi:gelsolin